MGHTVSACKKDVAMSEVKRGFLLFGPWLTDQRWKSLTQKVAGMNRMMVENNDRCHTWKEIM